MSEAAIRTSVLCNQDTTWDSLTVPDDSEEAGFFISLTSGRLSLILTTPEAADRLATAAARARDAMRGDEQ